MRHHARRRRLYVAAALTGALAVGAPVGAAAYWQYTASAPAPAVSGATLAPTTLTCTSIPAGFLTVGIARLTWTAVPGATGYTVSLRTASGSSSAVVTTVAAPATTYDLQGNLLVGLGAVISALLGGEPVYAVVTPVNNLGGAGNTWSGPESNMWRIGLDSLGGLLGGLKCL